MVEVDKASGAKKNKIKRREQRYGRFFTEYSKQVHSACDCPLDDISFHRSSGGADHGKHGTGLYLSTGRKMNGLGR